MTRYVIASVAYPAAEVEFSDFVEGLRNLKGIENCKIVIAEQGETNIASLLEGFEADVFSLLADLSIPAVRAGLFQYLQSSSEADHYIFIDIDDRLTPNALALHREALETADFSYGDQALFKEAFDQPMKVSLFELMDAPDALTKPDDLVRGNCVGLSAFACNKNALDALPVQLSDDLIATDWYITVHLLKQGMVGKRAGVVTDYCLKGRALRALEQPVSKEGLQERIAALKAHEVALSKEQSAAAIEELENQLNEAPDTILKLRKEVCPEKPMWYEDVSLLAAYVYKQ